MPWKSVRSFTFGRSHDVGMLQNPPEGGGGWSDEMVLGHKLFLKILILVSYNLVSQIIEQPRIQYCF